MPTIPTIQIRTGEGAVQAACGCTLVRGPESAAMSVVYSQCSMHAAAGAMLEALRLAASMHAKFYILSANLDDAKKNFDLFIYTMKQAIARAEARTDAKKPGVRK